MAAAVEISEGHGYSREFSGNQSATTATRVFRIVRNSPNENIEVQSVCGVFNGDPHPDIPEIFCQSFSASFEGASRMAIIATFQYATVATSNLLPPVDGAPKSPEQRPPNWSTTTSTYESPIWYWRPVSNGTPGGWTAAENPVGDMYDGISRLEPIINLAIEQYQPADPLIHSAVVGSINSSPVSVGGVYSFPRATMLLRGISASPHVEPFGNGAVWRGWKAVYEFSCKANPSLIHNSAGVGSIQQIGWDIAVPQSGFNVRAFAPATAGPNDDPYGQPLKHDDKGKIKADPLALPSEVSAGEKVRAMIKIFSYNGGGASQTPSAQPIPLSDNGRPRKESASPKVLVYRYRVYDEYDFNTLGIRLQR